MIIRYLEIRTQRIFNNLIKQNQKLASDFVLKQSTIVSSAKSAASKVKHPTSNAQRRESRVQCSESRVQRPESSVQRPESSIQIPESSVQCPASSVQRPESSVQSPASNSCVQSPGIRVCHLNLMYNMSTQWNQQLTRYMFSKVIECLEQNIRKQIDCKRPSKRYQKIN